MSSAITIVGIGAAASAYGASQNAKAAKAAGNIPAPTPVNIKGLDADARKLSKQNIADSIDLEKQYTPEVAALRTQATQSLLPYLQGEDTTRQTLGTALYGDFNAAGNNPLARSSLLDEAIAKARNDLALGGTLDTATRNEVTRRAGATAAGISGGRVGLGRDISARDLGLKSLDLQNSRLQAASQLGGQDQSTLQAQAAQDAANAQRRQSTASLISDLQGQTFAQRLGLAQFGQGIARPETGLDPSSLVDLTVGNSNASNAAAQQKAALQAQLQAQTGNSIMQLGGQFMGAGAGLYGRNTATQTTPGLINKTWTPSTSQDDLNNNILGTWSANYKK